MPTRKTHEPHSARRDGFLQDLRGACVAAVVTLVTVAGAAPSMALPFGVNAHIPDATMLSLAADAGLEWVRIDVLWSAVEPSQNYFVWDTYDALVAAAESRGVRLYATIADTPAWATAGSPGRGVPSAGDWYDFCYRAASRYRGRIAAWGMWNEPNNSRFFEGGRRDYIDVILKPGAAAVHAADPRALACGPEISHLRSEEWQRWLEQVLSECSEDIDVVTQHVYPDNADPDSVVWALDEGGDRPWEDPSVRSVLERAGWFGRPFWLTETGCNSVGTGSEPAQASFVSGLLASMYGPDRDLSWVGRVFFYELVDDPRFPTQAWGLLGPPPGLRRKPSYQAVRTFTSATPVDDGEILSDTIPASLPPGTTSMVTVSVHNTGSTTWSAAGGYALASPRGGDPLAPARHPLPDDLVVPPGTAVSFAFEMTAPPSPVGGVVSDWQMVRDSALWFGELLHRTVTVTDQPGIGHLVVPSVANAKGRNATYWRTELVLHNAAATPTPVEVTLLEQAGDNTLPRRRTLTLAPNSEQRFADAVNQLFGVSGVAAIRLDPGSDRLAISGRTYTEAAGGSCGQHLPAIPSSRALRPGTEPVVIGLAHSPDPASGSRTNIGIINGESAAAAVDIEFFGDDGGSLGTRRWELAPLSVVQSDNVLGALSAQSVSCGRARVSVRWGAVVVYASVVDNASGDPALLLPQIPSDEPRVIVSAAHRDGLNGTRWRTDLVLFNADDLAGGVEVGMLGGADQRAAELRLPPGEVVVLHDVLAAVFGYVGSTALEIRPFGIPIVAWARTYTLGGNGTFGQEVEAVPPGLALEYGEDARLIHMSRTSTPGRGTRSNLGIVNLSLQAVEVTVLLFATPGSLGRSLALDLAPRSRSQLTDVFAAASETPQAFAVVIPRHPNARLLPFASVVDNATGDSMLVPGWPADR